MNTELQAKLLEIITDIQGQVRTAGEQLPEIASSFIIYGRIYETMFLVVMVALIVAIIKGIRIIFIRNYIEDFAALVYVFGAAALLVLFISVLTHLPSLLMVWAVPKVWILAELLKMVN